MYYVKFVFFWFHFMCQKGCSRLSLVESQALLKVKCYLQYVMKDVYATDFINIIFLLAD